MRTFGKTRTCAGCRCWSEQQQQVFAGKVERKCLSTRSTRRGQFQPGGGSCTNWESGDLGAVDDHDPDVQDAYREQAKRDDERASA